MPVRIQPLAILTLALATFPALAQTTAQPQPQTPGEQPVQRQPMQVQPSPEAASDPGFRVEIQGVPTTMDEQAFADAVLAALPAQLLDADSNFTRSEIYDPQADYRLLLVFHAEEEEPTLTTLCARAAKGEVLPDAKPPEFEALTTTTKISAAFCRNEETLTTATDRMTGRVTPDQASFRFLVADVSKQLFPSGFENMPGTPAALTGVPPG